MPLLLIVLLAIREAFLGKKKKTVVYPQRWWNSDDGNSDLFWDDWQAF